MKKADIELKKTLRYLSVGPVISGPFLFFYAQFTIVENELAKTLTDAQAQTKLKALPKMEVTYFKLEKSETPMPEILKGRKELITEEVKGIDEVIDLIFIKSGAKLSETDLLPKTT